MNPQLAIQFTKDRSTAIYMAIQANRNRAETNCLKLLKYWQEHNYHISKYEAAEIGIDCLAQRVKNLKDAGVPVQSEIRRDIGEHYSRYWLECTCHTANKCYLHDADLRVI